MDDVSGDVREPVVASAMLIRQLGVVNSQLIQDRGVEVMHVAAVLRDFKAIVVRLAIGDAALDTAACHP